MLDLNTEAVTEASECFPKLKMNFANGSIIDITFFHRLYTTLASNKPILVYI